MLRWWSEPKLSICENVVTHQANGPCVYIMHESPAWYAPLDEALARRGVPHREILLDRAVLDLSAQPGLGIYFNRLSATAHTRGHKLAVEHCRAVLRWLELYGRRIVNGREALEIAMSKTALILALNASGIRTPKTVTAVGLEKVVSAARHVKGPFLIKPNRGGKGLGIVRFQTVSELAQFVSSGDIDDSADGVYVIQELINSPEPFITRAEFVGGAFMYALQSETGHGFNLCPADNECATPLLLPAGRPKFHIREGFEHSILEQYRRFLERHHIEVAAIEFIVDRDGDAYTYDLNINTNYNGEAEAAAGRSGMDTMAAFLGNVLHGLPAHGAVNTAAE